MGGSTSEPGRTKAARRPPRNATADSQHSKEPAIYIYTYIHVNMYMCMYIYICTYRSMYMYVCAYIYMYGDTYMVYTVFGAAGVRKV